MQALFYKGEDVTLTFTSPTDISSYSKVVKFFTPFGVTKTASVTAINNFSFSAKLTATDTLDLPTGSLNIVLEFTSAGNKVISKTIEAKLADPYIDGSEREAADIQADIVFIQNQAIQVNFAITAPDLVAQVNTAVSAANTATTNANTATASVNDAVLSAGYLGAIAFNAAAPTPGRSGYYEFSSAGSCSWITGGAVTVKVGDRASVQFTSPSTYVYRVISVAVGIQQTVGTSTTEAMSQNASSNIIYSQIKEILRFHNPALNYMGIALTSTATPTNTINNTYLIAESGTIFGVTGCLAGQIIYGNQARWIVEWPTNRANRYDMLSALRNIFSELKSNPVATAYSTYAPSNTPLSTFNGWRYKCNFIANFRVAELATSSSVANKKVVGYVWDENSNIVATATAFTKLAGATAYTMFFVFDKEITADLVGSKFWIGYRAEDYNSSALILMDGSQNGGSEGGLIDTTVGTQYSTYGGGYDNWFGISVGSRLPYIKLYDSTIVSVSGLISNSLTSAGLNGVGDSFVNSFIYDSYASQLTWTTQDGGVERGSPFTGWGAVFNKVNISFNAIKLPAIKRSATVATNKRWRYIQAVVKDSAASSTILAISPKIPLDVTATTINNVIIPLMNTALTSYVTLTDASFAGSTYFIGFCFYAEDGTYAYGGPATGSQSNFASLSYYITNTSFDPSVPTIWSTYAGNYCIPMEHALLTNPKATKHLVELDAIDTRIKALEAAGTTTVEISLPDKIYATVGDTLQLFYRGMIKAPNPYIYDILVTCSKGKQFPRYFEYLPVIGDVGTTTFKIEVKSKDGGILGTKTCSLITKAAVASPSTLKKVLCVGDSLTSAGIWCQEASRRLIGSGGTPSGLGLTNISFLGRKTGGGIGFEGTGGWTWSSYATVGFPAYKFNLSGVSVAPALGAIYSNNGVQYTVTEVNLTAGSGYISGYGIGTPTASGTLTKVSGAGDATLTFSSYTTDSANPFWDSTIPGLNFTKYVNDYMGGSCDVIYFLLTWNGLSANMTNFTSMISTAKTLVDHIRAAYPSIKIKIMGIQVPSINGGMGENYGATGAGYADTFGMIKTAMNMNTAYQDWCNEAGYSASLEFVNVMTQFDSENNMPFTNKAVNTRSTVTEKIGTNGVHPDTIGYYQIGDVVFRNFVANFCQ